MNNINRITYLILIAVFFSTTQIVVYGQSKAYSDSLTLADVIKKIIISHPAVKQAEEALNSANSKIELSKSSYYPEVNIEANYTRIDPVPAFSFPGFGHMELAPNNNYNANLSVTEKLWDFGKTVSEVEYETENKQLSLISIEQIKQQLSLAATNNFFSLVYLQEAIAIKDEQLKTLKEHLSFIEKKGETGSATQYEILSTKVKISNTESQKLDLEAMQKTQLAVLNSLISEPESELHYLKNTPDMDVVIASADSLINYAYENRDEIKISVEKTRIAKLHYDAVANQNNPVINLFASGGAKNGYEPDIYKIRANYAAGFEIRVPVFDAFRNKNNRDVASSSVKSSAFQTEKEKKTVLTDVVECNANILASKKKIEQFTVQLTQAQKALSLAEVSYKAGAITNLDLLDATTALSESKLYLLKANIDYLINMQKLKAAIGKRLY